MKTVVSLVIDMTDEQIADYAAEHQIPVQANGRPRMKDIVEDVQSHVLALVQAPQPGIGRHATVTLKNR